MKKNKIKVVWLCAFSNEEKRSHLRLWRAGAREGGQWIPNLLRAFETDDTFELHVISSDNWMVSAIQSWTDRNITYHCFKSGIPVLGRHWPSRIPVNHITDFWLNRLRIRQIVRQVNPDVIHLFGVENPEYGAAALDLLNDYPVFVTIQGFIHRERHYHDTFVTRVRCRYEEALIRACSAFSGDYESEAVVRGFNSEITYRNFYFPVNEALIHKTSMEDDEVTYDLLFVGRLNAQKGVDDFLKVAALAAEKKPDLKVAIVGNATAYPPALEIIERYRLKDNVCWLGRLPTQEGLFKVFRQSKLFLAPTYNDCFPSTIRESMLLGTPVIAYATGGIPWANRNGQNNIVTVPQGDCEGMVAAVLLLLRDADARIEMALRAKEFAEVEFSLKTNADIIRKAYRNEVGEIE